MNPLVSILRGQRGQEAAPAAGVLCRRLALVALVFLLPWTASARDRARFTASPEPGRAEAFAVRLDEDLLMSGRLGDLARVQALRESLTGDFLWMRHEGLEYVLQDANLLAPIDELWSKGDEGLIREEKELAEGRGTIVAQQRQDLEERREQVRGEQAQVADEKSRLSDELSRLTWRESDLRIALAQAEEEFVAQLLQQELDDIERLRHGELSDREDKLEREEDELDRRMAELDREGKEIDREADAIDTAKAQIDARRDELLRRLDETLLRLLERTIAQGTVQPLS